jgi:hypothetical protein
MVFVSHSEFAMCGVLLHFVVVFLIVPAVMTVDYSKAGQLLAMQRFYELLGGGAWKSHCRLGWENRATEYCSLAGVGCDANSTLGGFDNIISLAFFDCNLAGTLPQELLNLRGLQVFDIQLNSQLTGSVPAGFGFAWPRLTRLAIGSTSMHGTLQLETGNLRMLKSLVLNDLYLTGSIPDWWGTNLTKLEQVNLCSISFSNVGKTRDRLRGSIPETLKHAVAMQEFMLCYQFVSGELSNDMIASWPNLVELKMISNSLIGTIPQSLATCLGLVSLELQQNQFVGPIPPLGATFPLINLTLINVAYNTGLTGTFPAALVNNRALQFVGLNDIGVLYGVIPVGFEQMKSLRVLLLTNAVLTGTLPEFFSSLPRLQELTIRNCSLSGSLYDSWAIMNLSILDLGHNQLEGTIPNKWFPTDPAQPGLFHLRELYLHRNNFHGTIPEPIFRVPLEKLSLDGNSFNGTIPESFSNWRNLVAFYIHENKFTGTLSPLFSSWTNNRVFSVMNNSFAGTLPPGYSAMPILLFYVAYNKLNGTLPASYSAWSNLTISRFEFNQFSGTLPAEWSKMTSVNQLTLLSNRLTGYLPVQWAALAPSVTSILLDNNLLTGPLPSQWSALTSAFVSLTGNHLTGPLSSDFNAPLMFVAAASNCFSTTGMSAWWMQRTAIVLPQRTAAECGIPTFAPPVSTPQPQPGNSTPTRNNGAFVRSAAAAVVVVPLLALSGAMPTGGAQRLLLQFSLLSCATDLSAEADVASNPLQLEFGDVRGAAMRGTVVGDFVLLMTSTAFGCTLAVCLGCRRHVTNIYKQQRFSKVFVRSLCYVKFPGILSIPFLFLAQPILSSSVVLLRYSPGGGADVAVGVFGLLVVVAGTVHIAIGVRCLRTGAHFTKYSHRERRPSKGLSMFQRVMNQLLGVEVGRWSNASRGSMFVEAWGSLFEGYRGHSIWSWIPDACVRSFVVVELTAAFLYGLLAGLVPAEGGDDNIGASSSRGKCTELSIATLVITLCHTTATLVLWPFISRWEMIMGASPTILGALWIVLALAEVGDDALNALNEAQVWLFVISLAANFLLLLVYGDWLVAAKRWLLGLPRYSDGAGEDEERATLPSPLLKSAQLLKTTLHVAPSSGKLMNLIDATQTPHQSAETTSLRSLGDVVQLICTYRQSLHKERSNCHTNTKR